MPVIQPTEKPLLVVDDEYSIVQVLDSLLERQGFTVRTANNGEAAVEELQNQDFAVVLTDIRMGGMSGLELLSYVKHHTPETPVVLMTANGSVETAAEGVRLGAFDYVTKPFKVADLTAVVERAAQAYRTQGTMSGLPKDTPVYSFDTLVGTSPEAKALCQAVRKVALTDRPVRIAGGPGTGKTAVARAIHRASRRAEEPFLAIDCSALDEERLGEELLGKNSAGPGGRERMTRVGALAQASAGTVLLRHVGSLSETLQSILANFLEDGTFVPLGASTPYQSDARIMVTDANDLPDTVAAGRFHPELFSRLKLMSVTVPDLRGRQADIKALAAHFLREFNTQNDRIVTIEPEAVQACLQHTWPRNASELRTALTNAAQRCRNNLITLDDLPPALRRLGRKAQRETTALNGTDGRGKAATAFLREKERKTLKKLVERFGGDQQKAAVALGIEVSELRAKLGTAPNQQSRQLV